MDNHSLINICNTNEIKTSLSCYLISIIKEKELKFLNQQVSSTLTNLLLCLKTIKIFLSDN